MNEARWRIRAMRAWDVDGVLAMVHELARFEALEHELTLDREGLLEAAFGRRPWVEGLVAEASESGDGGPLAGYALSFKSFSTFRCRAGLYLEDLFVRPRWRRQGIGLALLREVCASARQRGFARVEWSVLDWNSEAIAFYRQLGGIHQPEWQRFRLEGAALARVCGESSASEILQMDEGPATH